MSQVFRDSLSVLVLGSGGREHALVAGIAASPTVNKIYAAPGNPGISQMAELVSVDISNPEAVTKIAKDLAVDLVVIGPEMPLVLGVADSLRQANIPVFGPDKAAAKIEGSKAFAKEIMTAAQVPTAESRYCTTLEQVEMALAEFGAPYVVKADGLAAGKGVIVTDDQAAALAHAQESLSVIVEEYLDGPEVSLFAVTDGKVAVPLLPAQDFKRVADGDLGPNTGGMGAYTPLPWAPEGLTDEIMHQVVNPTVAELAQRGTPFVGLLYAGLALTSKGLRVVEFNARFGDPETQAVLSLLDSDLAQLLYAAATGQLADFPDLAWQAASAMVVVVAAEGYPGSPKTGGRISGLSEVAASGAAVLQAGTKQEVGELVAAGGRVLGIVTQGPDLKAARDKAYQALEKLEYSDGFWRHDIALKAANDEIATPKL